MNDNDKVTARKARLAAALRRNLRRRKAAGSEPETGQATDETKQAG